MPVVGIGRHAVKVVSHVIGKSGTGTPHVGVLFEDVNGDRITWYGYLSDKAIERTVASLGVLGWDPQAHNGLVDSLNGTDLLVGAEAEIVVEAETYEGKVNHKVRWVNEPGGGSLSSMEDSEAASFAASLRQKILAAPKPKVSTKPGPAKEAVPAGSAVDDDLPF